MYQYTLILAAILFVSTVLGFSAPATKTNGMSQIEAASVQRFQRYDKLCKTCPTLLQPKIATLEEMIMGLPVEERDRLLANVVRRIAAEVKEETVEKDRIQTAEDIYRFQTGTEATIETKAPFAAEKKDRKEKNNNEPKKGERINSKDKLLKKMEKTRSKFEANKVKLKQVQHMLEWTNQLLAGNNDKMLLQICEVTDSTIYHMFDEMKIMSRQELKMQRLKYMAQKIKYEQKIAKCRVKMYGASLQLAKEESKMAAAV